MSSDTPTSNVRRGALRLLAGVVLGVVLIWGSLALALDRYGVSRTVAPGETFDAVVVAGAGVKPGGVPSIALYERTRKASALVRDGHAPVLALTGGVGDHPPSEAEVARRLAEEWGVAAERIVLEDTSTSTEENAAHLAEVLGARRIVVVSDHYHLFRVERVFRRHFADVRGVGVHTSAFVRTRGALREVLAVTLYAVTGRLGPATDP